HSSHAPSGPYVSRATSYLAAPPRRAKPPFRPLAPSAMPRASCTRTLRPPRARARAHAQPVIPAPITTTSTESRGFTFTVGRASSSQKGVVSILPMLLERAIAPVTFRHDAGELQLGKTGGHLGPPPPTTP